LKQAVETLRKRGSGRVVSVLYAGCGPWATLALPLLARYPLTSVKFTLLDIHPQSLESARGLIETLGLEAGVSAYVLADAASYRIPPDDLPDIIVTETMSVALRNEPQVTICRNLCAQAPEAILIPEEVRIELAQIAPKKEHSMVSSEHEGEIPPPQRRRIYMGEVFSLNKANITQWQQETGEYLPANTIVLPRVLNPMLQVSLLTTITVYGGIQLKDYDCSLTLPIKLQSAEPLVAGYPLHFHFRLGAHPELVATQDIAPDERPKIHGIDRKRLPLSFDAAQLAGDLQRFAQSDWIDHFVPQHYEGTWQALPLRAPVGATHPIQQICSHPGCDDYCNTGYLMRSPYFREVLDRFQCELLSVRLMKLNAGSRIKEHTDLDLSMESGYARLHIPITTNPQMEFILNGEPIEMKPGECWYLRLSDPHCINNNGGTDRVHMVLDVIANDWLNAMVMDDSESLSNVTLPGCSELPASKSYRGELRKS
jgi:hypothetical protein